MAERKEVVFPPSVRFIREENGSVVVKLNVVEAHLTAADWEKVVAGLALVDNGEGPEA